MTQLKSINLSNIRRYGPDTTIELSPGATILLAPNGTGKTAFFEAIELSLTGGVARLGSNLSPIIRDNQSQARVTLDFGEVRASVEVSPKGHVKRAGDLSPLFPETKAEDIPFLLRLTHLLDQREGEWLVKAEAKMAGAQLERLPLGKEGAQVSSSLISIRRVLNDKLKQAKGALEALEAEFEEWQSLVLERNTAASQAQGSLRSKESIADSITSIAREAQASEQLPKGLLVPPLGVDSLETMRDALEQTVQARINRLREQIAGLVEADGLIGRFISEQSRSEKLGNELIAARQVLTQKEQERAKIVESHKRLQQQLVLAEAERDLISHQLNRLNFEAQTKRAAEQHKEALATADKTLTDAQSRTMTLQKTNEGNEQIIVEHELINRQRKVLQLSEANFLTAHQLIRRWETNLQQVTSLTALVTAEESREIELKENIVTTTELMKNAQSLVLGLKQVHETLSSTADSIRQSVASIAAHLPSDRGDCPVCGINHGATNLQIRITKSLESIDPKVVEAERNVKQASDQLRERTDEMTHAKAELEACQRRMVELKSNRDGFTADINQIKSDILLEGDTIQLAKASLQRREEAHAAARRQLDEKQHNLASPPTPEMLEASRTAYQTAVIELESARQSRDGAQAHLDQSTAALAALTVDASPSGTLEELSVAQTKNAALLSETGTKVTAEQSALDRKMLQLTEANNSFTGVEEQITDAQNKLSAIRYAWRQLSFSGDPSAEVASSKETQLQSSVAYLSRQIELLQALKIEINTWNRLEQTRLTQTLIDRRRGASSEEEFDAALHQRIENENRVCLQLSQLSEAIETLSTSLSAEIANVHKHVRSVVPRWQSLLKRVVREQRFTSTDLGFRSIYKKGHAEVSVPLHGKAVPVPAIASEAQLTDLQLTFLLSMAVEHQWSTWRCLLLDDPTQHHDLVHAASVFDLLRDYIVDHGFQVVIATHDALQARYFMRKLQNDGIEARLWSLAPTPEGVTATEMQTAR